MSCHTLVVVVVVPLLATVHWTCRLDPVWAVAGTVTWLTTRSTGGGPPAIVIVVETTLLVLLDSATRPPESICTKIV